MANARQFMAARTAAWEKSGSPLPYLRRVAYLESHGTEWIDTGFVCSSETVFRCEFSVVTNAQGKCLFGGRNNYNDRSYMIWTNALGTSRFDYTAIGKYSNADGPEFATNTRINVEKNKNRNYVNGVETNANTLSSFVCQRPAYLFGANDGGTPNYMSSVKVFSVEISDGEKSFNPILVLDLSGRPAMYDEVSGQFFYNQGTGEFDWGELT